MRVCVLCEGVCVFCEGVWCGVLCKVLVWMCGCVKMCVCGLYVLCEGLGCTCESACMDVCVDVYCVRVCKGVCIVQGCVCITLCRQF